MFINILFRCNKECPISSDRNDDIFHFHFDRCLNAQTPITNMRKGNSAEMVDSIYYLLKEVGIYEHMNIRTYTFILFANWVVC